MNAGRTGTARRLRRAVWAAASAVLLACGGQVAPSAPRPAPTADVPVVEASCREDDLWLARCDELIAAGRLERALREAGALGEGCAARAGARQAVIDRLRAELGLDAPPMADEAALALVTEAMQLTEPGAAQSNLNRAHSALTRTHGDGTVGVLHAPLGLPFDDGLVVGFRLLPHRATWLAMTPKGAVADMWSSERIVAGANPQTAAVGITYSHADEIFWLASATAEPRPGLEPIGRRGDEVVAWQGDRLAVLGADSFAVTAVSEPLERDHAYVYDDVVALADRGFATSATTVLLPSMTPGPAIEGGYVLIDPQVPRAVVIGEAGDDPWALASARARVVDLASGKTLRSFVAKTPSHARWGHVYAFDRDKLAILHGYNVFVVDLTTGASRTVPLDWYDPEQWAVLSRPGWSRDGRYVCAGMDEQTGIVDTLTGRQLTDNPRRAFTCLFRGRAHAIVATIPLSAGHQLRMAGGTAWNGLGETRTEMVVDAAERHGAVLTVRSIDDRDVTQELVIVDLARDRVLHRIDLGLSRADMLGLTDLRVVADAVWVRLWRDDGGEEQGFDLASGKTLSVEPPEPADELMGEWVATGVPALPPRELTVKGALMAHATADGTHLYDWKRGRFVAPPLRACRYDLSPNGRYLAITPPCGDSGSIIVREVSNGSEERWFSTHQRIYGLAISNSGQRLALATPKDIIEVDLHARRERQTSLLPAAEMLWLDDEQLVTIDRRGSALTLRSGAHEVTFETQSDPELGADGAIYVGEHRVDGDTWDVTVAPPRLAMRSGDFAITRGEETLGTIVVFGPGQALAFLTDGRVDHLGGVSAPALARCKIGPHLLPYRVCEDRWRDDGALARLQTSTASSP